MMKTVRFFVAALLTLGPALAVAGESVHGVWLRGGHDEKMEFYGCDGKLCAKGVEALPDGSPPPLILDHAEKTESNKWKGDLFNPEDGKLYPGTITLESANQMTLTGCLIGFLCQSESWSRVAKAPAASTSKTSTDKTLGDKTPGDKSPGDKSPSAKTPGDKTPSTKTPSAKPPAVGAPAPKTAPPAASTQQ